MSNQPAEQSNQAESAVEQYNPNALDSASETSTQEIEESQLVNAVSEKHDEITDSNDSVALESNISVTESAQEYLANLLDGQEEEDIGVRIFVENAGTPRAECCMAYSYPEDRDEYDVCLEYKRFTTYIDSESIPYLVDAVIDYNPDRFGGQLTFRAPNSKVPQVGADASIEERIIYILQSEINPGLASHGGNVELLELIEEEDDSLTAVLKFGGGCQGCSAVDITLRSGVEVQLKEYIPEITKVVDSTDHSNSENAYYK